jgi:preprotein translocase subunit YajC
MSRFAQTGGNDPMNLIPNLLLLQDATPPAATQPAGPGGMMGMIVSYAPLIMIGVVFWLLMIRPEQKNRKKRQEMLAAVKKGDKVVTSGGLYGTVVQIQDRIVTLQVAEGVRMRFTVAAIQDVVTEETGALTEAKTT